MTWAPVSELGFRQHRVHIGVGGPAGHGLNRLGAADFTAVHGDRRIQRHVLRLERRHADTAARQHPAQTSHQRALAGVRCGSLNHQCWCRHAACPRLPFKPVISTASNVWGGIGAAVQVPRYRPPRYRRSNDPGRFPGSRAGLSSPEQRLPMPNSAQWRSVAPGLAYRCGGSAGIAPASRFILAPDGTQDTEVENLA